MPNIGCNCGGSNIDRFYALFTCDHVCTSCRWTNNKCCNGCYSTSSSSSSKKSNCCLNYYDIDMQEVITSRIKAFGYCDNHKALGIQYVDGRKRLYLNVDRSIYEGLVDLNKDLLFMFLEENISSDDNQCIVVQ